MESNKWDIEKIITHEFSFLQIEDAIKVAGDPNERHTTYTYGKATVVGGVPAKVIKYLDPSEQKE